MRTKKSNAKGVQAIIKETRHLFHRLKLVAEQIHGHGEMTASMRGVMESLNHSGPQTVPQMARSRPVSRQHIQNVVNVLLAEGMVEYRKNPLHKKSQLVQITAKGKKIFDDMMELESKMWKGSPMNISEENLIHAAAILRKVRRFLESENWKAKANRKR